MAVTKRMADLTPEERRAYMQALRARQTQPGGFAGSSARARQAQARSVAARKARQAEAGSAITEVDAPPTQETT